MNTTTTTASDSDESESDGGANDEEPLSATKMINKLTAMGFTDLEKNKRAIVATNENVAAAIEYLVVGMVGV